MRRIDADLHRAAVRPQRPLHERRAPHVSDRSLGQTQVQQPQDKREDSQEQDLWAQRGPGEVHVDAGDAGYSKSLKSRHVNMIAIGGAIGTGLFLGAGGRLADAGPSLAIAYAV